MVEDVLYNCHCLLHVFTQTGKGNISVFVAKANVKIAGKVVHLTINLAKCAVLALQLIQKFVGDAGFFVIKSTIIVTIIQLKTAVVCVLHIQNLVTVGFTFLHIFVVIHKNRLDGLNFHVFNFFQEVALHIAVHHHGRDFGLINFLDIALLALAFIDHHIVVVFEGASCKINHIFLGHQTHVIRFIDNILPVLMRKICHGHGHGTVGVAFKRGHVAQFTVVDGRRKQILIPIAGFQNLDLLEQQVFQLFQGLSLFGSSGKTEISIIIQVAHTRRSILGQLFLVDVLIDDTAGAVHQYSIRHLSKEHFTRAGARINAESDLHICRFQTIHIHYFHLTDGFFFHVCEIRDILRLNLSKIFVNQLDGLFGIKITSHGDTVIVRHIIGIEVLDNVGQ